MCQNWVPACTLSVLCCSASYAHMHFVCGLFSANGRAAVVEFWQWYPLHAILRCKAFESVEKTLRETGSSPRANAEREQQCAQKKMFWQQCREVQQRHRRAELCAIMVSMHMTSKECNTSYREVTPTVYGFFNVQPRLRILLHVLLTDEAQFLRGDFHNTWNYLSCTLKCPQELADFSTPVFS